jgi:hypothetical protein
MSNPYTPNFAAMGLPATLGWSPFNAHSEPIIAKLTKGQADYQRKKTAAQRTASVLRENKNQFAPETQASKDRTAAITGKSIFIGRSL